jgi:hypothetical protein
MSYKRDEVKSGFSWKGAAIQRDLSPEIASVGAVTRQLLVKTPRAGKDTACVTIICKHSHESWVYKLSINPISNPKPRRQPLLIVTVSRSYIKWPSQLTSSWVSHVVINDIGKYRVWHCVLFLAWSLQQISWKYDYWFNNSQGAHTDTDIMVI